MAEYICREELIEHLDKCRLDPLFDPDMARTCYAIGIFVENMKSADVQPVDRRISCKEQMPEDGVSVLICSYRGVVSKATYDSDMGYFYIADSELHYNELDITHWQTLPEPPKDGDS